MVVASERVSQIAFPTAFPVASRKPPAHGFTDGWREGRWCAGNPTRADRGEAERPGPTPDPSGHLNSSSSRRALSLRAVSVQVIGGSIQSRKRMEPQPTEIAKLFSDLALGSPAVRKLQHAAASHSRVAPRHARRHGDGACNFDDFHSAPTMTKGVQSKPGSALM
jgi:hypothetical protein